MIRRSRFKWLKMDEWGGGELLQTSDSPETASPAPVFIMEDVSFSARLLSQHPVCCQPPKPSPLCAALQNLCLSMTLDPDSPYAPLLSTRTEAPLTGLAGGS